MNSKLKSFLRSEQTFLSVLMVVIGLFSFQLGQSSVQVSADKGEGVQNQAGVVFSDVPETKMAPEAISVVASRNGTKYHKLNCPGVDSIKQENKIYFDSIELAKAAGYSPAASCDF